MSATALRPIHKLFGKSYKVGEEIPDDVIAQMSPQSLQALVSNQHIDVPGMEAKGGTGAIQHMKAKVEKLEEHHKKSLSTIAVLQQAKDDLAARVTALEAAIAAGDGKPKSKREARKTTETQE